MSRDVRLLHPKLQEIVEQFKVKCAEQGLNVLITETFRTKEEQNILYAKGRTAYGKIVTNATYPNSLHNWAVAFDFCRNVRGREYENPDNFFNKCGAIGEELGLRWGGRFRTITDLPHLELPVDLEGLKEKYGTPSKFISSWLEVKMVVEDKNGLSEWAKQDWEEATRLGITDGSNPQSMPTKEQVVIMIMRALKLKK